MKQFSFTILLAGGMAATVLAGDTPPAFIAHRGASHSAPENTLASMRQAWKEGADGVEADFHLSSDGEVVCIHDFDTLRTTGTKLVVKETPWQNLSTLDAGSWKGDSFKGEKIPRLGDIIDELPAGKFFFVEIKSGPAVVAPIKRILEARRGKFDTKHVIFISFDAAAVAEARLLLPEHEAHLISSLKEFGDAEKMKALEQTIGSIGAQGFQFRYRPDITRSWMQGLRDRGLKLDSWVINDPGEAARLIGDKIDFITTDRPGPLRSELQQQGILK